MEATESLWFEESKSFPLTTQIDLLHSILSHSETTNGELVTTLSSVNLTRIAVLTASPTLVGVM